jgi:hypothetical protein
MYDGAHTHHDHHPPVLWIAVVIGLVLALGDGAIDHAITTLVHVLLLTVLAIIGLTAIGITVWLIAAGDTADPYRRRRRQLHARQGARLVVPAPEQPEVMLLRAELEVVSRQLAALQARETHSIGRSAHYPAVAGRRQDGDAS